MTAAEQFSITRVSPSYWRVTFDNGPVNLLDPDTIDQLAGILTAIENDPDLTVVVFRSDKPGYFMAHWDFTSDNTRVAAMPPGPTGLHPYLDNFVRLSRLPVATISEIRGRAREPLRPQGRDAARARRTLHARGDWDRVTAGRRRIPALGRSGCGGLQSYLMGCHHPQLTGSVRTVAASSQILGRRWGSSVSEGVAR